MPKYIDTSKIRLTAVGKVDEDGDILVSVRDVRKAILQTPAADVAPKGEVVSEIIEKIKTSIISCESWEHIPVVVMDTLIELKKKYIPQDCSDCQHFVGCECFDGKPCDLFQAERKEKK